MYNTSKTLVEQKKALYQQANELKEKGIAGSISKLNKQQSHPSKSVSSADVSDSRSSSSVRGSLSSLRGNNSPPSVVGGSTERVISFVNIEKN